MQTLARRLAICYQRRDWRSSKTILLELAMLNESVHVRRALGKVCAALGQIDESVLWFRRAIALDASDPAVYGHMITMSDLTASLDEAMAERRRWWGLYGRDVYARRCPHTNDRDADRPIRVGYVSGDFRNHSAMMAISNIILNHSDAIEPFYYSSLPRSLGMHDAITELFASQPGWRDISEMSDEEAEARVRQDEIDILVDMSGHTTLNRLLLFCRKPAPIQATGFGYGTGTGLPAMDYLFADPVSIPVEQRDRYVERIVDLPCIIPYGQMPNLPPADGLPCACAAPTFGVFQRVTKLSDTFLHACREVLHRVPGSRIVFKGPGNGEDVRSRVYTALAVDAHRVVFYPESSNHDHMRSYRMIDVTLDTFPATGGVSSMESLWMGVPPVTLIGEWVPHRVTAAILTVLGLQRFVARTEAEYVDLAVSWVTERKAYLAEIRKALRTHMTGSPLCFEYDKALESAYRTMWREWCAKSAEEAREEDVTYA